MLFFISFYVQYILVIIQLLFSVLMIFMSVAFFSLLERKILSLINLRLGPNKVTFMGLLQPFSDALKLISKQNSSPYYSSKLMYWISPVFFFAIALQIWLCSPILWESFLFKSGILYLICCLSLSIYGLIFSGWFANSKYASIGSVRSVAQMISYEIILSFIFFLFMVLCNSVDLSTIESFNRPIMMVIPFFPIFLITMVGLYAESNRTPFDLSEGESELVGGFCVEYGSISYTLVFLSENASLLFSSYIILIFFLSYELCFLKLSFIFFFLVWTRGTYPRIRYDKMMQLCWQNIIPMLILLEMMYFVIF